MLYLYKKLKDHFTTNGYLLTYENESGLEMTNKEGFVFSQMKEEEYVESTIYLVSDDLLVAYDILSGEYETDLFDDTPQNKEIAKTWKNLLEEEVDRLELVIYIIN